MKLWNSSKTIIRYRYGSIWMHFKQFTNCLNSLEIYLFLPTPAKREKYYLITPETSQRYRWSGKKCLFNNDKLDFQLTYCLICLISCIVSLVRANVNWNSKLSLLLYFFRFKKVTPFVWHMIYVVKSIDCKSQGDRWLNTHQIYVHKL